MKQYKIAMNELKCNTMSRPRVLNSRKAMDERTVEQLELKKYTDYSKIIEERPSEEWEKARNEYNRIKEEAADLVKAWSLYNNIRATNDYAGKYFYCESCDTYGKINDVVVDRNGEIEAFECVTFSFKNLKEAKERYTYIKDITPAKRAVNVNRFSDLKFIDESVYEHQLEKYRNAYMRVMTARFDASIGEYMDMSESRREREIGLDEALYNVLSCSAGEALLEDIELFKKFVHECRESYRNRTDCSTPVDFVENFYYRFVRNNLNGRTNINECGNSELYEMCEDDCDCCGESM